MIKKGIISNINGDFAEAFIPDENNTVTAMLPLADSVGTVHVGDKCLIAIFDSDHINLADGIIVATFCGNKPGGGVVDLCLNCNYDATKEALTFELGET